MHFRDFNGPGRGPEAAVRLALYPLVFLAAFRVCAAILHGLTPGEVFLIFLGLAVLSPAAYLVRESRQGRPQRHLNRRGAERTPLLPPDEELQ